MKAERKALQPISISDRPSVTLTAIAALLLLTSPAWGQTSEPEKEEIFELSPFTVETTDDKGYWASNTLSGTRLNTQNRYVGASVTEVTEELLEDLAVGNFEDVVEYIPNSAKSGGGGLVADMTGNEGIFSVQYRVRGFVLNSYSRDFFKTRVAPDSFNTDRLSFSRGPNSVLFGIGQPGGVTNAVSARALFKNENKISTRFDTWGSGRYTGTLNKVIWEDKLAIRIAILNDDDRNHRHPYWRTQERYYGALTLKPFENTTLRLQHEVGEIEQVNIRAWSAADGITVWQDAGSQPLPGALVNPPSRTSLDERIAIGVEEFRGANPHLIMTTGDITQSTAYQAQYEVRTAQNNVPGFSQPSNGGISFTDNEIIPIEANVLGSGNKLLQEFTNTTVMLEQRLGRNLFLELAFNRQETTNLPDFTTGSRDHVYVDILPTVRSVVPENPPASLNGEIVSNPNIGRLFTYNPTPVSFNRQNNEETYRAMLSYEFDFESNWDGQWANFLGRHTFAGMYERYDDDYVAQTYHLRNAIRNAGSARYDLGDSWIGLQNYINVEEGRYNTPDFINLYPRIWTENATDMPLGEGTGIAPFWLGWDGDHTFTRTKSSLFVMQNYFWNKRIVTTFGWRSDDVESWFIQDVRNTDTGLKSDVRLVDPRTAKPLEYSGDTMTRGVVVTPQPWIGFFYNESENFKPGNAGNLDIFGDPIKNETGEGKDYGIKFFLLDGKLQGTLTFFETSFLNQATNGPRTGPVEPFDIARVQSFSAIRLYYKNQGAPELADKWNERGYFNNDRYVATQDFESEGFEFSITYNPIPTWRLLFNFSKQENVSNNVAPKMKEWAKFIRSVQIDPTLLALETLYLSEDGVTYNTVADNLDVHDQRIIEIASLEGFADQRQPQESANFVTSYSFQEGILNRTAIGGSIRWRSKAAVGYQLIPDGSGALDATKPYYNNETLWFGVFVRRYIPLGGGDGLTLQINIDNLFDDDNLNPMLSREVNGQRFDSRWRVREGRSFALTAIIRF